jgi:uncharacterized protein YjiS (DUF1127 family)
MAFAATADFTASTTPGFFARMGKTLRRTLIISQTRRALGQLSDHQLKDIGIARDQIDAVARDMAKA